MKSFLVLYGTYRNELPQGHWVERKVDVNILELVTLKEFSQALHDQKCYSYFCALSLLMEFDSSFMNEVFTRGGVLYQGGAYPGSGQIKKQEFIPKVIMGSEVNDVDFIEKVFISPITLMITEVPRLFATVEAEPEIFKMKMVMIDEWFGIFDFQTQELVRYELELNCVKQEDLNSYDVTQIFFYSKTAQGLVQGLQGLSDDQVGEVVLNRDSADLGPRLDWLKNNIHSIKAEDLIQFGGWSAAAITLWKLKSWTNPVTAFFAGLGILPVAASDYCSMYQGLEGLKGLVELSETEQIDVLRTCPGTLHDFVELTSYVDVHK